MDGQRRGSVAVFHARPKTVPGPPVDWKTQLVPQVKVTGGGVAETRAPA